MERKCDCGAEICRAVKRLKVLPRVICLHLKRFKTEFDSEKNPILQKIEDPVKIDETINVLLQANKMDEPFQLPSPLLNSKVQISLVKDDDESLKRAIQESLKEHQKQEQWMNEEQEDWYFTDSPKLLQTNSVVSLDDGDYKLICVIQHKGFSLKSGHYVCDALILKRN